MSKKIVSFEQDLDGVTVKFGDSTSVRGDILVGADGAHSAVRKHLYKTLEKQELLPESDNKEMNRGYISLVGTTDALDPVRYPGVLDEDSESFYIIGDKNTPYTVSHHTYPSLPIERWFYFPPAITPFTTAVYHPNSG
jgi:2-polyprenyl-6-methoxyphenol hydroxylase-like FAD-dependent oxidoreductase